MPQGLNKYTIALLPLIFLALTFTGCGWVPFFGDRTDERDIGSQTPQVQSKGPQDTESARVPQAQPLPQIQPQQQAQPQPQAQASTQVQPLPQALTSTQVQPEVQRQDLRHPEKIPGEDAFLKGDYATAIPLIMDSFSHGNVRAAFYARIIFENGLDGRASDPAGSQKALDIMVLQFQDIRTLAYRSPGAVRPLYQTALALLYYRGLVPGAGENNLLEARRLASTAAKAGFIPAMNLTAAIACDKNPPKVFGFYRVDSDECYDWTQEAAETGDLLAMTNLSYLYRDGVGTNRDPLMAVNWAHQAASHHPPSRRAQNDMGCYHIIGEALSQDLEEAKVWFTQAATTYPIAQINLERLGQGTPLMESVINY